MECGDTANRNQQFKKLWNRQKILKSVVRNPNPVIFDVGAHWGESIEFFFREFDEPEIYSFEPDPNSYQRALQMSQQFSRCQVFNVALSDKKDESVFYRSSLSHLSSLSAANKYTKDHIRLAQSDGAVVRESILNEFNQEISVTCETLDSFVEEYNLTHIDLLKLDVQGWECHVLRGAQRNIGNVSVVIVEISLFDFYETQTSFHAVESCLPEQFTLHSLLEVSNNPSNGRTDWVDALYVNSDFQE